MDFETFRDLKGWTLEQASNHLRDPGDTALAGINASVISKHERGLRFPTPEMVARYTEITDGAVTYDDWNRLRERLKRDGEIAKRPTRKKSAATSSA